MPACSILFHTAREVVRSGSSGRSVGSKRIGKSHHDKKKNGLVWDNFCSWCVKTQKLIRAQKSVWCNEWLRRRGELESHVTHILLRELHDERENYFIQYMRMDVNSFYTLLAKVEPYTTKQDTQLRQSLCAEARLEATLRFLAFGCSYTALEYSTRISKQSLSLIIPETCQAIYTVLRDDYLKGECLLKVY